MKISETEWTITKPPSTVLAEFSELNGDPEEVNARYNWTNRDHRLLRQELYFDENSGSITLENHLPDFLRPFLVSLLLFGLIAVITGFSAVLQAAAALSAAVTIRLHFLVSAIPETDHDIVSWTVEWEFYFSVLTAASLLLLYPGFDVISRSIVILGAVSIFISHYIRGMLPVSTRGTPGDQGSYAHLRIPFLSSIWVVASIVLLEFSVFLRVSGVPFQANLVVTAVVSVVGVYVVCLYCSDSLTSLFRERVVPFGGEFGRMALFAAYLLISAASLTGVALGLELVYFGVFREGLLSSPSPEFFLYDVFRESDQAFRSFPVFPAEVYSGLINALAFLPVFFVYIMWMVSLFQSVVHWVRVTVFSERLAVSYEWLSSGVEVVSADIDGVYPYYSVLTGRRLVVVGQEVIEVLEPEELEAVVAHEYHHFVNRDLRYHWIATAVSVVLIGGKNSLLAFYDHPQAELDADDYSVEKVNKQSFITALRKLEGFSAEEVDLRTVVAKRSNGFGVLESQVRGWLLNRRREASDWVSRKLVFPILATYYLFFGGALFDAAHLSADDRIERL